MVSTNNEIVDDVVSVFSSTAVKIAWTTTFDSSACLGEESDDADSVDDEDVEESEAPLRASKRSRVAVDYAALEKKMADELMADDENDADVDATTTKLSKREKSDASLSALSFGK